MPALAPNGLDPPDSDDLLRSFGRDGFAHARSVLSAAEIGVSHVKRRVTLRALERRDWVIVEEMMGALQDDIARAAIIRLRGPRQAPEVAAAHAEAYAWLTPFAELIESPRWPKR